MILAVDGPPVEGMDSCIGVISALSPGKRVPFTALDHLG